MKFIAAILCLLVLLFATMSVSAWAKPCVYDVKYSEPGAGIPTEMWEASKYQSMALEEITTHSVKSKGCANLVAGQYTYDFMDANCEVVGEDLIQAMVGGYDGGYGKFVVAAGRDPAQLTSFVVLNRKMDACTA